MWTGRKGFGKEPKEDSGFPTCTRLEKGQGRKGRSEGGVNKGEVERRESAERRGLEAHGRDTVGSLQLRLRWPRLVSPSSHPVRSPLRESPLTPTSPRDSFRTGPRQGGCDPSRLVTREQVRRGSRGLGLRRPSPRLSLGADGEVRSSSWGGRDASGTGTPTLGHVTPGS